jgi:hypothetical protein
VAGTFRLNEIRPLILFAAVRPPHEYGLPRWNDQPRSTNHKFMLLDFPGTPKLLNVEFNRNHSYRKLSTGSIFAARAAGTVPNRIPTTAETKMATIAESPEMGMR